MVCNYCSVQRVCIHIESFLLVLAAVSRFKTNMHYDLVLGSQAHYFNIPISFLKIRPQFPRYELLCDGDKFSILWVTGCIHRL